MPTAPLPWQAVIDGTMTTEDYWAGELPLPDAVIPPLPTSLLPTTHATQTAEYYEDEAL